MNKYYTNKYLYFQILKGGEGSIYEEILNLQNNYKSIMKQMIPNFKKLDPEFKSDHTIDFLKKESLRDDFDDSLDMIGLKTCHALAILFIHYMQSQKFITNEPFYYPHGDIFQDEKIQNEIYENMKINTINRCLIKLNDFSLHEFILVILNNYKYIIQVNMYNLELHKFTVIGFNDDLTKLKQGDRELFERLKLVREDDKRFTKGISLVFHGFCSYKII
jgi:hypothetical protein